MSGNEERPGGATDAQFSEVEVAGINTDLPLIQAPSNGICPDE
jgi:hypothetical protein